MSSTDYDSAVIGISVGARPPFLTPSATGPSAGISSARLGYCYGCVSGLAAVCRRGARLSPAPPEFTSKSSSNYSAEVG